MNEYFVYVNGLLMPSGMFDGKIFNAAIGGKFLQMTVAEDEMRAELDAIGGKIRRIDVLESRASKVVKRYRYAPPVDKNTEDENFIRVPANDETKEPARLRFRCAGIANAF